MGGGVGLRGAVGEGTGGVGGKDAGLTSEGSGKRALVERTLRGMAVTRGEGRWVASDGGGDGKGERVDGRCVSVGSGRGRWCGRRDVADGWMGEGVVREEGR